MDTDRTGDRSDIGLYRYFSPTVRGVPMLQYLKTGRKNAISRSELARLAGVGDRKMRKSIEELRAEALKKGEGLYIEGSYGTGKTHLAAAIAIYLTEREYSVVMKTSFDLFEEIKRTFDDTERTEAEVTTAYKDCDLLIIDDLGKEQCTDWSMSVLYSIVNDRYEAMKPMIITTNFNGKDLIKAMTPKGYGSQKIGAIISRLREVSKPVTMAWKDFRSE